MLRLLIDQDFDHDILRGLQHRVADLDAVTAHQAGLSETSNPELLEWAAENERVLITHDRKTMPHHAAQRIAAGEKIAGVIVVPRKMSVRQAIDELDIVVVCSLADEWRDTVRILPL